IPSAQVQNITTDGVAPTFQNTRFCEFYAPQEVISKNNTLTLEYTLRGSRPENNFWVSWTTIGCGGIILRNNSELIVYKSHFTNDKEERQCQWTIKAPIGFVAKIFIEQGYFMGDPNGKQACDDPSNPKRGNDNDGIEFYAGTDNSSGVPQKIMCGIINNQSWTSQTNEVFAFMRLAPQNIMHKNDAILKGKVEFVKLENDASCGGIIQLDNDTPTIIHSPNYPKAYPKGISCIWEFHAPNGSLVAFNLSEFNNPSGKRRHQYYSSFDGITTENCSASMAYLEGSLAFYEGSYNASEAYIRSNRMMHRVCLQIDKPRFIISRSQKVVVVFHGSPQELSLPTDDKTQKHNGFMLKAWAKCGGTLTARRESQSFIIANGNDENPTSFRFNCTYRFVKDPEDEDEGDTLYIRGERLPYADISPRANALDTFTFQCNDEEYENHVDFKQDLAIEKDFGECDGSPVLFTHITEVSGKYLINYGLESQFCGGIIDQFQKHIKFRINKRKPADCEWQFNAPNGFQVSLHVDLVKLPESELCQESFIEIRQSSANESEPRICNSEDKIRDYASPQITVRLRYHPNEDRDDEELDEIMGDYTLQMKSKIDKIRDYASPQITVRLRYHPNEDRDDDELDEIMGDYTLQMKSKIGKKIVKL
uniref:CUB domain-containing protein n=1 Tax=Panagrolaimus sp. ES5 TaxID=591445 RepID=A0AC34FZ61_9BILA